MQIGTVTANRTVSSGGLTGKFLRMSGSDALVELSDGRRVMWSAATEVEVLSDVEEIQENQLPKLEAELARLMSFTQGKYAQLGVTVDTPCIELPKQVHAPFIEVTLRNRPPDAILCRRCGNKLCIRGEHLFWGTRSDCQRDMCLRGVARPSGKSVTVLDIAAKILKIRKRISRLTTKLIS